MATNSTESAAATETDSVESDSVALAFRIVGIPLGIFIVVTNIAFILTMTWHKTNLVRRSTQILFVSNYHCAVLAGLVLIAYSVAFPYTSSSVVTVSTPSLLSLCHLWGALQLTLIVLDSLHIVFVSLDHSYAVTSVGCSIQTHRIGLAVLFGWLYALLITLLTLAFDHLTSTQPCRGGCDILDLNRYYGLTLLIHVIAGALCCAIVVANVRRTLNLHQRQIQVTNTITYKNLLFEMRMAQLNLLANAVLVLAWIPLTVAEVTTHAGVTSKVDAVRLTFLVGNVSYLKAILYVAADREIRRDFARVASCTLPVQKNRSLSSSSR